METLRSEIEFEKVNKNPVNSLTAVYILVAMKLPVIEAESSFGAPMVVHSLWSLTRVKSCNGCMVNHYMTSPRHQKGKIGGGLIASQFFPTRECTTQEAVVQ